VSSRKKPDNIINTGTFADQVLVFFQQLRIKTSLPDGVEVLNPYKDAQVFELCRQFYKKYYDDHGERLLIVGINPGRLGAGLTGIPFTDPVKLQQYCGIKNTLPKKPELSADFIYAMIRAYGGPEKFYKRFYFASVSPLGFVKEGKNLNYYDIRELKTSLRKFIVDSLQKTLSFGINRDVCYCLGEGENFRFLSQLNDEMKYFRRIIPLSHPRFIMQYRRKKVADYIADYVSKLNPS
jgi:Domain of unknown function (DUF4918)